jgi:hypothetical protein
MFDQQMMMNWIIGIVAAAFYVPSIAYAIWKGRSWIDILVVGVILMILATGANELLPPWGTIGFVVVHLVLTGLGIRGVVLERRTKAMEKSRVEHPAAG